jgi:hypothetical protein
LGIEVGLMGDNPRLDPIHRDGFPLAARKALHRRRCASTILPRPAVVFGPVDSPILSFPSTGAAEERQENPWSRGHSLGAKSSHCGRT